MLGAVNSIAALLGTADRSTNIELVTCVNSGFCGVSSLPGATDLVPDEEQETVSPPCMPLRSLPTVSGESHLQPPCLPPARSWPARQPGPLLQTGLAWLSIRVDLVSGHGAAAAGRDTT